MGGTEGHRGVEILGGAVHPGALGPVEWQFFPVEGEKILAEKLAEVLEDIAEPADDRVVPTDRMPGLVDVDHVHVDHRHDQDNHRGGDHQCADFKKAQSKCL